MKILRTKLKSSSFKIQFQNSAFYMPKINVTLFCANLKSSFFVTFKLTLLNLLQTAK